MRQGAQRTIFQAAVLAALLVVTWPAMAAQASPTDAELDRDRAAGFEHLAAGRPGSAYPLLRRAWEARPRDWVAGLGAARAALALENVDGAAEILDALPAELPAPIDPEARLLRARVLSSRGEVEAALGLLEPLLAVEDVSPEARMQVANLYVLSGRSAEAVEVLRALLEEMGPGRAAPTVQLLLAQAQYRSGAVEDALATLEPLARQLAGRSGPLAAAVASEYGRALLTAGRLEEAAPVLERAARLAPGDRKLWLSLAQAWTGLGEDGRAEEAMARYRLLSAEGPEPGADGG